MKDQPSNASNAARLTQLADLHREGAISDEDYAASVARLAADQAAQTASLSEAAETSSIASRAARLVQLADLHEQGIVGDLEYERSVARVIRATEADGHPTAGSPKTHPSIQDAPTPPLMSDDSEEPLDGDPARPAADESRAGPSFGRLEPGRDSVLLIIAGLVIVGSTFLSWATLSDGADSYSSSAFGIGKGWQVLLLGLALLVLGCLAMFLPAKTPWWIRKLAFVPALLVLAIVVDEAFMRQRVNQNYQGVIRLGYGAGMVFALGGALAAVVASFLVQAPDRPEGESLPLRWLRGLKTMAAVCLVALAVAFAYGAVTRPAFQDQTFNIDEELPAEDPNFAALQQAADQFNQGTVKNAFRGYLNLGSYRCSMGFAADFPELVLITMVSSSGPWLQVNVDPTTGVQMASLRNGDDYSLAGFDDSFWANGYDCNIGSDGSVSLTVGDY